MNRLSPRGTSAGFTLLEVLLATAIMAVGTTSVLVVIATAAGMASQRQVGARREQVIDEARHVAQAMVDAFHPDKPQTAKIVETKKGTAKSEAPTAKSAPENVSHKKSSRYDGFNFDLSFSPKDRLVPEKGFDVAITIHYGGDELSYSTSTSMISTTIPDAEFLSSTTFDDEKAGIANRDKPSER